MSDIFISYRREDSADVTGRINDHFCRQFGEEKIFTDVDNIPLGVDFRQHLDKEVSHCEILIAVIGPEWIRVSNNQGHRRLDDPGDFVRIEIESALNRDIPVIPVLVRRAIMPTEDELPESIKPLAYRNATLVRPDPDFRNDMNRLIGGIKKHLSPPETEPEPVPEPLDLSHFYNRLHLAKNSAELDRLLLEVKQLAKKHDQDIELKGLQQKIAKAISSLQVQPRDTPAPSPAPPKLRSSSTYPMGYLFASILVVMISIGIYFYIGPGQQTDPDIDQVATTANNREAKINALLAHAQQAFDEQRQTDQPVLEILQEVQRLDPGNPRASEMREEILRRYIQLTEEAIARGDFDVVAEYLQQVRRVNPDSRRAQEVLDRLNYMVNEASEAARRDPAQGKKPEYRQWLVEQKAEAAAVAASSDKTFTQDELMTKGKSVYAASCAACHGPTGAGIPPVFPEMTNSPIVLGDINAHIDIVVNGKTGTAMQAFKSQLSDVDLAAVITFERNSFGNTVGDMVQPSTIKSLR